MECVFSKPAEEDAAVVSEFFSVLEELLPTAKRPAENLGEELTDKGNSDVDKTGGVLRVEETVGCFVQWQTRSYILDMLPGNQSKNHKLHRKKHSADKQKIRIYNLNLLKIL